MSYFDVSAPFLQFNVNAAVYQPCTAGWNWSCVGEETSLIGNLIWLVEGGNARLQSKYGDFTVRAGDFFLMPLGEDDFYIGTHDPENPLIVYWAAFNITDEQGRHILLPVSETFPCRSRISNFTVVRHMFQRMTESDKFSSALWLKALLSEVQLQGHQHISMDDVEKKIKSICEIIQKAPEKAPSIPELASRCHYSPDHFIRVFRNHIGMTPLDYIIQAKIEKGRQLLLMSSMQIQEVAAILGYPDAFTFSKQFKSKTGVSPSSYRNK